jgi:hypothetical protein
VNPPAVRTDADQVMDILHEEGGRIYQRELVDRTEWSASKVSRLLSTMEDDGLVEKVRIGRENVVTVADTDSADAENEGAITGDGTSDEGEDGESGTDESSEGNDAGGESTGETSA